MGWELVAIIKAFQVGSLEQMPCNRVAITVANDGNESIWTTLNFSLKIRPPCSEARKLSKEQSHLLFSVLIKCINLSSNLFYGLMMKKILVTYQVKDPDWWVLNNKLQQATAHLGFRYELFRKKNTNVVGYVVEIPNEDDLTDLLVNTTDISTRLNEHGVLLDTIEILEALTNN